MTQWVLPVHATMPCEKRSDAAIQKNNKKNSVNQNFFSFLLRRITT
ncbi:hypothetical protein [Rickettsia felis]|nr:hypothetical protein [Rickettsia felis]